MNRRSFLTGMAGILAAGTAPWVVTKAGVLMPVREIAKPGWLVDGIRPTVEAYEPYMLMDVGGKIRKIRWFNQNDGHWMSERIDCKIPMGTEIVITSRLPHPQNDA